MIKNIFSRTYKIILLLLPVFFLVPAAIAFAADLGLIADQSASYESINDETNLTYTGILMPWFSAPLGNMGRFYLSLGFSAKYEKEAWTLTPELLETELKLRMGEGKEFRAGRLYYSDPLGFTANGLFDGVRYSQFIGAAGKLNIGAWYTGLLYKKSAHITMTEEELDLFNEELDYSNFFTTYFAPRRLIAAVDWEHWGRSELTRLRLSLLGQYDLSGSDELYHSQYLIGKLTIPVKAFIFNLGGVVQLTENDKNIQVSFAGELGIGWLLPTAVHDRLLLLGRFSAGTINDTVTAFVPITTVPQGNVLKAKLSGLSMIQAEYTVRLHQSFSLRIFGSYFILSDMGTYQAFPDGRDGYFLGSEFYGQLVWSPFSDMQIKAGGGAFLPALGNADKNAKALWQIDLSVVVALF